MVINPFKERMRPVPNLPVKWSISIGTILNFDGDGHDDGDGTCKQALILSKTALCLRQMKCYDTEAFWLWERKSCVLHIHYEFLQGMGDCSVWQVELFSQCKQ